MNTSTSASCGTRGITTEKVIRAFAGAVVLLSLAFGASASPVFLSAHWLWVTAFVGANLFQSSFTGVCPLNSFLRKVFHLRTEAEVGRADAMS